MSTTLFKIIKICFFLLSNLNGKYFKEQVNDKSFNSWTHWVSLKTIKMLIRRRAQ